MRIREFAVPLQALVAMLVCSSLGWMVYTIAFFDPNPPTAAEVYLLETQDPEILVLKAAAALTVDALLFGPTDILMPVTGPSSTPTFTSTSTSPPLSTLVSVPTITATDTRRPWMTPTGRRRENPDLPAATATPRPPTNTPTEPPATTALPTDIPTDPPATALPTTEPSPTEPPPDPTATEPPPANTPTDEPPSTQPPTNEADPTQPPSTDPTSTEPAP